jgi:tryptophan synthase alpha chain
VSRIAAMFARTGAAGRAALVPYLTAGDPNLDVTADAVRAAVEAGADAIELGVPFSDPMADGPVLQRSAMRALSAGTTLTRVLGVVEELRRETDVPIVLFGYFNPIFRYGVEAFATAAASAGADGVLCVDLPPEEAGDLRAASKAAGLDLIALLAPTTPPARIRMIARAASGFLYFVSVLGVTGGRDELPAELPALVERVRRATTLPVGVGFGVQTPAQAGWVAGFADAVIVGSAIARRIEDAAPADVPSAVGAFVGDLARGLRAAGR